MGMNVNDMYPHVIPAALYRIITNSYYGKMGYIRARGGYRGGYVVKRGARGSGKMYHLMKVQGWGKLVAPLIRFRLRDPYWKEGDIILARLLDVKHLLYSVDVNSWYPSIYVDTDSVTRYNGL
jgi:hypothetical protein